MHLISSLQLNDCHVLKKIAEYLLFAVALIVMHST